MSDTTHPCLTSPHARANLRQPHHHEATMNHAQLNLYYVTMSIGAYVVADDAASAEAIVKGMIPGGLDSLTDEVMEATHKHIVIKNWRGAMPFGEHGERTVEQWVPPKTIDLMQDDPS